VRLVWLLVLGFGGRGARNAVKALANRDLRLATAESQSAHGEVGKVLRSVLGKNFKDRASAEKSLEVLFAGEVPKLEMGLSWISVFASTAPLLGLLGTVMGMIELFNVITMHGTSDPKLLAGGISIALVTTEAGLIVAIPLQLLHTLLVNISDSVRTRMEKTGLAVLNAIWIKEK
jgi:biopolymer transport protein ExbB